MYSPCIMYRHIHMHAWPCISWPTDPEQTNKQRKIYAEILVIYQNFKMQKPNVGGVGSCILKTHSVNGTLRVGRGWLRRVCVFPEYWEISATLERTIRLVQSASKQSCEIQMLRGSQQGLLFFRHLNKIIVTLTVTVTVITKSQMSACHSGSSARVASAWQWCVTCHYDVESTSWLM